LREFGNRSLTRRGSEIAIGRKLTKGGSLMFWKRAASAVTWLTFSCGLAVAQEAQALAAIRDYALNYAKSLPDYTCIRVTQQKNSYVIAMYAENPELFGQHPQNMPSWTTVLEEELTVSGKRENHKVLKRDNDSPLGFSGLTAQVISTISTGEFGSVLDRIFESETGTSFHWVRSGKLRGRPVIEFSFDVPRAHGAHVYDNVVKHDVVVGYQGLIYADAESKAVLRVETHSADFPGDSEFKGMDLALDYKAAKIGERELVLPYRFELEWHRHIPGTLAKATTLPQESGVQAEYKNYRGFSAPSAITYGSSEVHSTVTFGGIASPESR
jgi:hypothetical protein